MVGPKRRHLEGRAHATANAGPSGQTRQPAHIGGYRFGNGQFPGKSSLLPTGEHGHSQQGGRGQPRLISGCHGGVLGRLEGLATGAGMHGDQLRPEPGGTAASPRHGGWDVVELEIKEHPQAELPQLGHHRWTAGPIELQAHLHPTQPGDRLGQGDGLSRVHAIEGKD